jgi:hypothetical protein
MTWLSARNGAEMSASTMLFGGRAEGYVERHLAELTMLAQMSLRTGATHIGWDNLATANLSLPRGSQTTISPRRDARAQSGHRCRRHDHAAPSLRCTRRGRPRVTTLASSGPPMRLRRRVNRLRDQLLCAIARHLGHRRTVLHVVARRAGAYAAATPSPVFAAATCQRETTSRPT